jgi:type VI secretion system protein ImpH
MAGTNGQTPPPLSDPMADAAMSFDFFRFVRLLENQRADLPRVGYSRSPAHDAIRFRQNPSLAFASSTIESYESSRDRTPPALYLRFFGLFGPNAPLPHHLTEYARERILHHDDQTLTAFLNIFHHRLASFFYRAWSANQKALDLDRRDDERFAMFIGSVFGLGMESLQNRDPVPDHAKLYFAGRLANVTRNAEGLEAILTEFLKIKTEIQTFVGRYLELPADSICQLGASPDTGQLGVNVVMGSRFFDCQLSFRIRIGPMSLAEYERLLPGGSSFERLKYWVLNYCGQHYFWDVQLSLHADQVPRTQLGQHGRLGWTTWLTTKPFSRAADDLILSPGDN